MIINGITRILTDSTDGFYYTTEKLFSDNILIEEVNMDMETWVSVYLYNDIDAMIFTLCIEKSIAPMVVYRMVKDIIDLHETNTLSDFIDIVHELSIQSMTSLSQSTEKHRKSVRESVLNCFNEYKELIENEEELTG